MNMNSPKRLQPVGPSAIMSHLDWNAAGVCMTDRSEMRVVVW
jgi:hypothetical protein